MGRIKQVTGLEVLDSRGNPTVEAEVTLASGAQGRAAAPSGASTGAREAVELRDGDPNRYGGRGVMRAVGNVNGEIAAAVTGMAAEDQPALDARLIELDGTPNKARLGANAILAVSLAAAKAAATERGRPLYGALAERASYAMPVPMMNIINGGAHANNSVDIQEFMILPVGAPSFSESLRYGAEVFHALREVLHARGLNTAVGDEGGFAPDLDSNEAALGTIAQAVERAGFTLGREIFLGLDVASSELYSDGRYHLESEDRHFEAAEFGAYLEDLVARYPIVSIEDGMAEGRLGRLGPAERTPARPDTAGRRRSVRHQHRDSQRGHRAGHREQHPDQAQPDRHADRDRRGHRDGARRGVYGGGVSSFGRDRRHHHRRYRGGDRRHPDQDGLVEPIRPSGEV